jgi:hypothetical protein
MERPQALAGLIAGLHAERERLCAWAARARDFAARHTMEHTFALRIAHLERARASGWASGSARAQRPPA